jgi:sugar lactone lactonase YvrE
MLGPGNLVTGLGVDSAGNVYVPDYGNSRIQVFAADGSFLTTWDASDIQIGAPSAVAIGPDDNVYIAGFSMTDNRWRIHKHDRDKNLLVSIETDENGANRFNYLAGITVDDNGNLYVCDVGVNRILKFDSQGQFLLEWGGSGSGPGLFNDPHSIDVNQDGTVFVTDVFNFRVQRFDSSGNYLGEWNNTAVTTTTLNRPFSVAAGDDGTIYVVDEANALHRYHLESP